MCQLSRLSSGKDWSPIFTIHKLESDEQFANLRDWKPSHTLGTNSPANSSSGLERTPCQRPHAQVLSCMVSVKTDGERRNSKKGEIICGKL